MAKRTSNPEKALEALAEGFDVIVDEETLDMMQEIEEDMDEEDHIIHECEICESEEELNVYYIFAPDSDDEMEEEWEEELEEDLDESEFEEEDPLAD